MKLFGAMATNEKAADDGTVANASGKQTKNDKAKMKKMNRLLKSQRRQTMTGAMGGLGGALDQTCVP